MPYRKSSLTFNEYYKHMSKYVTNQVVPNKGQGCEPPKFLDGEFAPGADWATAVNAAYTSAAKFALCVKGSAVVDIDNEPKKDNHQVKRYWFASDWSENYKGKWEEFRKDFDKFYMENTQFNWHLGVIWEQTFIALSMSYVDQMKGIEIGPSAAWSNTDGWLKCWTDDQDKVFFYSAWYNTDTKKQEEPVPMKKRRQCQLYLTSNPGNPDTGENIGTDTGYEAYLNSLQGVEATRRDTATANNGCFLWK